MIEERLQAAGHALPTAAKPSFNYVPVTQWQSVAYVSGQLPKEGDEVRVRGKVGAVVTVEEARRAATICVLQGLACLKEELGTLDRIARILKVTVFVASATGFNAQPRVADAASDLLVEVFGAAGRHARAAVGVAELPRDAPVEIDMIVAVEPA